MITKSVHECVICKEPIPVIDNDSDFSALAHLSEVHGIIIKATSRNKPIEEIRLDDELTRHLESIKGRKINN